ncbi:hypothetical protein L1987_27517 [Smallanthus sonchifolius]|uniref:Uncharacterized protein n=1 Tax=Smallanthus sonchifolius TaxID=185202 RepID=A0ACB9ICQ0_9ASTR|nr:hypothetical protein L1987_27517 [Smallanthus sonchifolius]
MENKNRSSNNDLQKLRGVSTTFFLTNFPPETLLTKTYNARSLEGLLIRILQDKKGDITKFERKTETHSTFVRNSMYHKGFKRMMDSTRSKDVQSQKTYASVLNGSNQSTSKVPDVHLLGDLYLVYKKEGFLGIDIRYVCVKGTQYDIHVRELFGWSPTFCEEVEGGEDEILDKEDEVSSESISNEEEEVLITKMLQRSAELSHIEGLNNINEMDFQIGPHETNKEQVQDDVVNDLKDGDARKGNDQVKDQGVDEEPVNIVSEDQEESSLSRPRGLKERCYVSPANRVTCDNEYSALVSVGSLKDTRKHNGVSMIEEFNKNIELGKFLDMT